MIKSCLFTGIFIMTKIFTLLSLSLCCYFATAADNYTPLVSGFYADSTNLNKDSTLAKIQTNESSITLLAVTKRNMYVSDGYGVNEYGGQFLAPIIFNYNTPNQYIANNLGCVATLQQESATKFKISLNDSDICFMTNGMFDATGTITPKMVINTFTLDTNLTNIQTLHGN